MTWQAPQPGCPAGTCFTALSAATCRGHRAWLKDMGVKPPKGKAVTGHRTPKSPHSKELLPFALIPTSYKRRICLGHEPSQIFEFCLRRPIE